MCTDTGTFKQESKSDPAQARNSSAEGKLERSFSKIRMCIALAKRVLTNYNRQHVETNTDNSWKKGGKKGSLDEGRQDKSCQR